MRWSFEFGGDPQDVTITTTGEATPEGFDEMNSELVEDERFRPGMLVLLDHTHLIVNELSSEDVRRIADDFVRHHADLSSTVVALVTPEPTQFGLARMSTMLADSSGPIARVFSTRPEALDWLRQVHEVGPEAST